MTVHAPLRDGRRSAGRRGRLQAVAAAPATGLAALVFAPIGRDGTLIQQALSAVDIPCNCVATPDHLIALVDREVARREAPELGAVLVTDDGLGIDWSARLAAALDRQAAWSDLPIILLAHSAAVPSEPRGGSGLPGAVAESLMSRGSVTVLDRPVRVATLVSAVRAAIRGRARQAEVVQLIEARTRAQEAAETAARVKSDFLAVMSHELRTPLNAIAGYADLLTTGCYGDLSSDQGEAVDRIQRAQRHLLGLINEVLDYARLERGRVSYSIEELSVAEILGEVSPLIEPQMAAKGLDFECHRPEPDVMITADRERLRQILLNLLSNAVKFTPRGGRVLVDTRTVSETQHSIEVQDSGPGIPAADVDSIFEPFVQLGKIGPGQSEGTGLGLAISRELARGMGGDLRVLARPEGGSTFVLELPRA